MIGVAIWLTTRGAPAGRAAIVGIFGIFRKVLMNWNRFTFAARKTSLATGLKYSVTINSCLIGKALLQPAADRALPIAAADDAAESQGICGFYLMT